MNLKSELLKIPIVSNIYWAKKASMFNQKPLRLVLGVGRSGTTWISNTLARTQNKIRFYEEPLTHIYPKLNYANNYDHVAIDYEKSKSPNERIYSCYKVLSGITNNECIVPKQFVKRSDNSFEYTLIKEVHGLMATQGVARFLNSKLLLVIRNPISVVDSTASIHSSFDYPILTNEFNYIANSNFVSKEIGREAGVAFDFLKREISIIDFKEMSKLLEKVLVVTVINSWFKKIAKKNVNVIIKKYEDITSNKEKEFMQIADFLDLPIDPGAYIFKCSDGKKKSSFYSISRSDDDIERRGYKFINNKHLEYLKQYREILFNFD